MPWSLSLKGHRPNFGLPIGSLVSRQPTDARERGLIDSWVELWLVRGWRRVVKTVEYTVLKLLYYYNKVAIVVYGKHYS